MIWHNLGLFGSHNTLHANPDKARFISVMVLPFVIRNSKPVEPCIRVKAAYVKALICFIQKRSKHTINLCRDCAVYTTASLTTAVCLVCCIWLHVTCLNKKTVKFTQSQVIKVPGTQKATRLHSIKDPMLYTKFSLSVFSKSSVSLLLLVNSWKNRIICCLHHFSESVC